MLVWDASTYWLTGLNFYLKMKIALENIISFTILRLSILFIKFEVNLLSSKCWSDLDVRAILRTIEPSNCVCKIEEINKHTCGLYNVAKYVINQIYVIYLQKMSLQKKKDWAGVAKLRNDIVFSWNVYLNLIKPMFE